MRQCVFTIVLPLKCLGIKSEEVVYKEDVWVGGGNAGPDVECIVRGLEVGTLVFMQYKVVGEEFVEVAYSHGGHGLRH